MATLKGSLSEVKSLKGYVKNVPPVSPIRILAELRFEDGKLYWRYSDQERWNTMDIPGYNIFRVVYQLQADGTVTETII